MSLLPDTTNKSVFFIQQLKLSKPKTSSVVLFLFTYMFVLPVFVCLSSQSVYVLSDMALYVLRYLSKASITYLMEHLILVDIEP